jgi:SsrA-binding protein
MEIVNRKANYNYFIEESYEAGIVLTGTEIKSIREGKVNIGDSYAIIRKNECYLLNMHISAYKEGSLNNVEENRTRKLLLHTKEINKLQSKTDLGGYTLIPLKLYFKGDKAKILLGVGKGKKIYDKRETEKKKDTLREIQKNMKNK